VWVEKYLVPTPRQIDWLGVGKDNKEIQNFHKDELRL
jgi:hypothetical protein